MCTCGLGCMCALHMHRCIIHICAESIQQLCASHTCVLQFCTSTPACFTQLYTLAVHWYDGPHTCVPSTCTIWAHQCGKHKNFTIYRINTSVNILRKRLQYGLDTQVPLALALQCARCRPLSPRGQDNQKTPEQKSRPAKLYHKQTKEMQVSKACRKRLVTNRVYQKYLHI